jgi:hypothetical protein
MRTAEHFLLLWTLILPAKAQQSKPAEPSWMATSNQFTDLLLKVEMKHNPESGSRQGLSEYDELISQPTLADEKQERKESEEVLATLKAALPQQKQKEVAQDLEIIIRRVALDFQLQDFQRAHDVPFTNASSVVFSGIRILLDEQTPAARRPAALARLRKYAALEAGYKPLTEIL